ncbi:MAG: hypothetical protein MJ003_03065 [Paludibacteraceae bacterium]|nr:hypothetical protein [Paludibacteraceae bacterium]
MKNKFITIVSIAIVVMGVVHIIATFTPLISKGLDVLPQARQNAMIYMSLMCGLLLIVLGGYVLWAKSKIAEFPKLKSTIQVASMILLIDGILAVTLMFHNPFAWAIGLLCAAEFLLTVK